MATISFDIAGPGDSVSKFMEHLRDVLEREINDGLSNDPELSIDTDNIEVEY